MRRRRFRPGVRALCLMLAGVGLCAWPTPIRRGGEAVLPTALAEEVGKWIENHQAQRRLVEQKLQAQERHAAALQERIDRLRAHNQGLRERIERLETQLKELTSIEKSLQDRDQIQ